MKNKIFKVMAVVLAAIFVLGAISVSAAPSNVKVNKDYRNMDILNRQGVKVNKPNDLLGLSYVKGILTEKSNINPQSL